MSASEAVSRIPSGATVAFLGAGGGIGEPTVLINTLADRFKNTHDPKNLTLYHPTGLGDRAERGMSPLAQKGMCRRIIGGHWGQSPRLAEMAERNEVEAYNFPMGVMSQLLRACAAGQPGIVTHIGLGTYIDPRQKGGRLNERTVEELVRLIDIDGRKWLYYPVIRPDVALIRGTSSDTDGYVSMEDEVAFLDVLPMAQAARNNGGLVIVQVQRLVKTGTLHPKSVRVPGYLVDAIVVAPEQTQMYAPGNSRFISGDFIAETGELSFPPLNERKVIARRALLEVTPGDVGNVGVGISDAIGVIAQEEGVEDQFTLTVELGPIGGVSAQGIFFGASINNRAVIDMPAQFDYYGGGGLDISFLSFAEVDRDGNVNVSRFAGKIMGTGGFIEISQNSKKAVFSGTLKAGGLKTGIKDGRLRILQEGKFGKFVDKVEEITFNGKDAVERGQEVVFITERAVFLLTKQGLELSEIAAGMDVERDILAHMAFRPLVSGNLKEMDGRLFLPKTMGLKRDWAQS
ncbi:MAG: acyl CoA:acetate/3-ketoacid CoA transferase [Azoarcus sp.]|nr:acyl CoA:acetate/3-ketoacid CoA transferase [Azoarcus sp.]